MHWAGNIAIGAVVAIGVVAAGHYSLSYNHHNAERRGIAQAAAASAPNLAQIDALNAELRGETRMLWWEGGSLHGASTDLWADASEANQIATAADFAIRLGRSPTGSMTSRRVDAFTLQSCITGLHSAGLAEDSAWETARLCGDLLEWRD